MPNYATGSNVAANGERPGRPARPPDEPTSRYCHSTAKRPSITAKSGRQATRGKHRRDALDRLIAAHARSRDLVLVTNNEADFRDYPGLRIENWVGAH